MSLCCVLVRGRRILFQDFLHDLVYAFLLALHIACEGSSTHSLPYQLFLAGVDEIDVECTFGSGIHSIISRAPVPWTPALAVIAVSIIVIVDVDVFLGLGENDHQKVGVIRLCKSFLLHLVLNGA